MDRDQELTGNNTPRADAVRKIAVTQALGGGDPTPESALLLIAALEGLFLYLFQCHMANVFALNDKNNTFRHIFRVIADAFNGLGNE